MSRTVRRRLLVGTAALGAAALALATAAPAGAASSLQPGLFGTADPTYDGVFRQSLALMSYVAADKDVPAEAVQWLLDQQCADGGFEDYRSDPSSACTASDPANYTGEDTNSTGIAAAALLAIGEVDAADDALAWLQDAQSTDGGFPYFVGGSSDANSTAVVLLATNSAGLLPTEVSRGGVSAADYLVSLQVGCAGAAAGEDGAFAYADFAAGTANDAATVQAALAITGAPLPFVADTPSVDLPRATCPEPAQTETGPTGSPSPTESASPSESASGTAAPLVAPSSAKASVANGVGHSPAELAGGYIGRLLDTYDGAVPKLDYGTGQRQPGTVSTGDTAWAVLALSAIGVGRDQRDAALEVLLDQVGPGPSGSARTGKAGAAAASSEDPGLLALAAMAVTAADGSAETVSSLVDRVDATLQTAASTPGPTTTGNVDDGGLAPSGATPLTPGLAGVGALLVLAGAVALGTDRRRRGVHA